MEYIVLPTFAYEHKIFVGPFSRKYPKAQVWVAPRQWSWPINLPLQFFGIFKAKKLQADSASVPWADEIDHKILSCPVGKPSRFRHWPPVTCYYHPCCLVMVLGSVRGIPMLHLILVVLGPTQALVLVLNCFLLFRDLLALSVFKEMPVVVGSFLSCES